ncbi:MAG: zinc-binding dehydrogenase [Thermoplasmata archaeon]
MRGFGFREHGGASRLEDVEIPEPEPGSGEVKIRLEAAGFNRLDRFTLEGIPGVPIERPHVIGSDGSGRVELAGEGVEDLVPGTPVMLNPSLWDGTCEACRAGIECYCQNYRILGEHTQGTATKFVVVPRRNVHPRPASLTAAEAASMPLVFQTAYRAVLTVGALKPGERVAVIGAGGGVATAATQIAHWRGAEVAVVTRDMSKADRARKLGANEVLATRPEAGVDKLLWEWSGKRGVDLILDSVGVETVGRSLRALARGGRLVVVGATTGPKAEIDLRTLFWRQASIRGSTMATASEFEAVVSLIREGHLHPVIDSIFPWAERQAAWRRFEGPSLFGKVVLELSGVD